MTGIWRVRAAILTLLGVLMVHQGRYALAPSAHEHELAAVHGYLTWAAPVLAALAFVAVAELAVRVRRPALEAGGPPALPAGRVLWAISTTCMVGVFGVQEALETWVAHGHLPGVGDLLVDGGWTAVLLAAAAGAVIALALRGAASAIRWALSRVRRRARRPGARSAAPFAVLLAPAGSVLARRLAGRAPPRVA
jgi:hypothetical protein